MRRTPGIKRRVQECGMHVARPRGEASVRIYHDPFQLTAQGAIYGRRSGLVGRPGQLGGPSAQATVAVTLRIKKPLVRGCVHLVAILVYVLGRPAVVLVLVRVLGLRRRVLGRVLGR